MTSFESNLQNVFETFGDRGLVFGFVTYSPMVSMDMPHDQFRVKLVKRFKNVLVIGACLPDSSRTCPWLSIDVPHDLFPAKLAIRI